MPKDTINYKPLYASASLHCNKFMITIGGDGVRISCGEESPTGDVYYHHNAHMSLNTAQQLAATINNLLKQHFDAQMAQVQQADKKTN